MNTPLTHRDPVCSMLVEPSKAAGKYEYKGVTYYFCSLGCKQAFERNPEQYLGSANHEHHSHGSH